jgi:hypothetical protein
MIPLGLGISPLILSSLLSGAFGEHHNYMALVPVLTWEFWLAFSG